MEGTSCKMPGQARKQQDWQMAVCVSPCMTDDWPMVMTIGIIAAETMQERFERLCDQFQLASAWPVVVI